MNVLLMGGNGQVGHEIALLLKEASIPVTILCRGRHTAFMDAVKDIPTIFADKNDEEKMKEVFQTRYTHIIDTVPSVTTIDLIFKYNKNLVQYIHCSSTGGYAPLPYIPCDEKAPYGGFGKGTGWDFKRVMDDHAMKLFHDYGFPATVIRPCYITGPGSFPLDNLGSRGQDFVKNLMEEKVLEIPGDGNTLLQPIHTRDLARSFLLAMEYRENTIGEIYNITLSHALTHRRYVELCAEALGKKANLVCCSVEELLKKYPDAHETNLRFFDCHMCFSTAKAEKDMNYRPEYTPEQAVIEGALWAAKRLGLID